MGDAIRNKSRLLTVVIMMIFFRLLLLFAEELYHHGKTVESEGNVADCLACHDGSSQPQRKGFISPARSHKVLIKYPPVDSGKRITFKPLEEVLAAGMKLENGMITCISCHDLNNEHRYHLRAEPVQKLCYVCHLDIR